MAATRCGNLIVSVVQVRQRDVSGGVTNIFLTPSMSALGHTAVKGVCDGVFRKKKKKDGLHTEAPRIRLRRAEMYESQQGARAPSHTELKLCVVPAAAYLL